MLQVYKECCKNCLLSPDSIVSPEARRQIIDECTKEQTYFICHKASMKGEDIVCKTFFDTLGHVSQMIRTCERFGMIEHVDQPLSEKLPTFKELV